MSVVLYDLVHDAETVLCDVMLLYLEISNQGTCSSQQSIEFFLYPFCKN